MGINVGHILRQPALRTPERVALVSRGAGEREHFDYGQLDEMARRVAGGLRARGLGAGARVALFAGNGAPFVAAWFGVLYAGCTVVPLPILSAPPEVAFRLEHAGCGALLVDQPRRELGAAALERSTGATPLIDVEELLGHDAADTPEDRSPSDAAMLLYTSGTTGSAKGAIITHASLATHTAALVHHTLRFDENERVLGVLPLTHSYGIRMVVLAPFYAGGRAVLLPRFDAATVLEACDAEGVTWVPAVPTMYAAFANHSGPSLERPPRWCLSAGAPLAESVRRRAEAQLGAEIRQGYGLTEATFTTIDAPPSPIAPGSVGQPVFGVEVRILDQQSAAAPVGVDGEIVVRGNNVSAGYLDDAEATAKVLGDGWLRTGDIGHLDAEGRLTVVDRLKDLIIRGGNNVYPSEVEDALAELPAVAEVAVVGRPDDYYGEEVVAVIVLRAGAHLEARELDEHARAHLAKTKVPRELAIVDALPVGPSGKVLKRELRARLLDGRLVAETIR